MKWNDLAIAASVNGAAFMSFWEAIYIGCTIKTPCLLKERG